MVYYGKPSKACGLCRTRKIKCDQLRPACSQCVRVAAACPGYRNSLDLNFRDERRAVEQKVHRRAVVQDLATPATVRAYHKQYLVHSISPPVGELVNSLFFHYFSVEDIPFGYAIISCLPQAISVAEDDALSAAVSSVGYALLSNITNSSDKLVMARQQYGLAVRLTRSSLSNLTPYETCRILRIILLLAMFEVFTCKEQHSMTAWSNHLEGATTLFEARGPAMSACILGRKGLTLFFQLRSQIIKNCLDRNLPVPDVISQSCNLAKEIMTLDELLASEVGDIVIRLANFRAAIVTKDISASDQVMSTLVQIDSDLERWALDLPSAWRYGVHTCTPRDNFYTNFYHKYSGFTIAAAWNQYRVARCLVNDLILNYMDYSFSRDTGCDPVVLMKHYNQAQDTILKICIDVCVSVPYFLRQLDETDLPKPGIGAFEVMWALATCASMHSIPEEQRLWAISKLETIGHEMGVHQALPLATLIRSTVKVPDSFGESRPPWEKSESIDT